jgi:hypothetical protein
MDLREGEKVREYYNSSAARRLTEESPKRTAPARICLIERGS